MVDALPNLHQLLRDAGLGRVADVIEREARPSIRLTAHPVADEAAIPLGASKLGGSPDLPPGFDWPRYAQVPMLFVAQINLREIASYDIDRLLPPDGRLYFFYDYEHHIESSNFPNEALMWNVHYATDVLLRRMPPPWWHSELGQTALKPCTVSFENELTLPIFDGWKRFGSTWVYPGLTMSDAEFDAYYRVRERLTGMEGRTHHFPEHRMLGYADPVQGDVHASNDDILLLQIDSDDAPNTSWGDTGIIYYLIKRDALARRDFSTIAFHMECS